MMTEILKNIIPYSFYYTGLIFDKIGLVFSGLGLVFYSVSSTTHMLFETTIGKKLKEVDKATQDMIKIYNNLNAKIAAQKKAAVQEADKLAKILKSNDNVTQLGKKNDDDSTQS